MQSAVFLDVVTQCGSCSNRRFGGSYRLHLQADRFLRPFGSQQGCYCNTSRDNGDTATRSSLYRPS
jgi:hypothetical protein